MTNADAPRVARVGCERIHHLEATAALQHISREHTDVDVS